MPRLAEKGPDCYIASRLNALSRMMNGHTCARCGRRSKSFSLANSGMTRNRTMGLRQVLNRDISSPKSHMARDLWCVSHDQRFRAAAHTHGDGAPLSRVSRYERRLPHRRGYADRFFTARLRSSTGQNQSRPLIRRPSVRNSQCSRPVHQHGDCEKAAMAER